MKLNLLKNKKQFPETTTIEVNEKDVFVVKNFNLYYGERRALENLNVTIEKKKVSAFIGPSGSGKSSFIRVFNLMNELLPNTRSEGDIFFNGLNIKSRKINKIELRSKVGMVFQKPTPFNLSIYENIAFPLRTHGIRKKEVLDKIVKESLKGAALWDEVKDDLTKSATELSGGQQQRLCIARTIALKPEVLLMDEPTSALDPIATAKIEQLILKLKKDFTIIIVTHSMAQAQRISDQTFYFYQGRLIEHGETKKIFTNPEHEETRNYINGKIG
ncbi:phosphate ABC transporter ATP-binding protein (PhoT family) [Mycoplasma testudineum]|uniref:Phosphate ABC transporter ATP-binding protein (PhoT family) n=1 Tax=Mycoplasma testudineum TaxID=244584 RepID=A0A4V3C2X6_9MOLU|nr:phosphate ABC transporter ATP-binding protein PstB [Mycoplasma testudineum]OYD26680.1 phosphate ABC transporter ATP-binding protein [Mycoplasma testudineum]TDO19809.1 phosphate ABC transporter ATP-binding protein (PhoT family) [Mycoplasma testudineum]